MTEPHAPAEPANEAPPRSRGSRWFFGLVAVVAAMILVSDWGEIRHQLFGSTVTDRSSEISASISARSCVLTGYEITNRLDGSKAPLYDCVMLDATEKCVTQENGIVNDVTAEAKLLFANQLSGSPPLCATPTS